MKGVTIVVEALLLIVIAISLSVIIGNWMFSVSSQKTNTIRNTTSTQLKCEFGNIFIKSAVYDCANSCVDGGYHNLTLNVINSGKIGVDLDTVFIQNRTGSIFPLDLGRRFSLDPGTSNIITNISTNSCFGINNSIDKVVVNSKNCPTTAFDSIPGDDVVFVRC